MQRPDITTETLQNIVLDSAVIYKNYGEPDERVWGATQGAISFNVEQTIRNIEINGVKSPLKGAQEIEELTATLEVPMLQWGPENLRDAMAGHDLEAGGEEDTHDIIRNREAINDSDYFKNIAAVGRVKGRGEPVIILLYNPMPTGNFEAGMEDNSETVPSIQFTAHKNPEDMDQPLYEIRYPKTA